MAKGGGEWGQKISKFIRLHLWKYQNKVNCNLLSLLHWNYFWFKSKITFIEWSFFENISISKLLNCLKQNNILFFDHLYVEVCLAWQAYAVFSKTINTPKIPVQDLTRFEIFYHSFIVRIEFSPTDHICDNNGHKRRSSNVIPRVE